MRTKESLSHSWTIRSSSDFGRAISDIRALRHLTQEAVAEQTAIPRTYLARIETGLTVALVDRVLRVLRRLGAEVTVTLRDDDAA